MKWSTSSATTGVLDSTHGLAKARMLASCVYSRSTRRELRARLARGDLDLVHVHNTVPLITGAVWDACSAADVADRAASA